MAGIDIRTATPDDVGLILQLIKELADYEKLRHTVRATEQGLRETLFGEGRVAEAVIASLDGVSAGYAIFFPNYSTFEGRPGLYLEDLYVRPEARRQGIGRALLEHLAKIAVDRDWARMEWSVLDWNAPSIAFYNSLGAKAMADWTTFRVTGEALRKLGGA